MPRRAAHPENPRQQALRAKRGGFWIEKELLDADDPSDYEYSEDGLYIGSTSVKKSDEKELINRFLTAALFLGALLRLIGLLQYSGFTNVPGKSCFVKRVKTARHVAKAGSKLALGFPIVYCLSLATIENGCTNYAFEIIDTLVALHPFDPASGEIDPVAFLREFISDHKHLPSCVTDEVRNTDAEVFTSDLSQEFELVNPSIYERTEQPFDPRFEEALETAKNVQRLVSCQMYDECDTERLKIGHFPYYKRKNSTEIDYDLVELSAVKLVLQGFTRANYYGKGNCKSSCPPSTWFTPFRFKMEELQSPQDPDPDGSVPSLARSLFTMSEIRSNIELSGANLERLYHSSPEEGLPPEILRWTPPWHPRHKVCDKADAPWILHVLGDTTLLKVKDPRYSDSKDTARHRFMTEHSQ